MELKTILDQLADTILARGTVVVREELEVLARSTADTHPGAAAALSDWEGSEIARERAFAVLRHDAVRADAEARRDIVTSMLAVRGVALLA